MQSKEEQEAIENGTAVPFESDPIEPETITTEAGEQIGPDRVREFSLSEHGKMKLSPHFEVREFACHDGTDRILIDYDLVDVLEVIRNHYGAPVIVRSGYRTPEYNAGLKNASPVSQHTKGRAADIVIFGIEPEHIAKYLESIGHTGGIGRYDTFTHIDTRPLVPGKKPARWDNRKRK